LRGLCPPCPHGFYSPAYVYVGSVCVYISPYTYLHARGPSLPEIFDDIWNLVQFKVNFKLNFKVEFVGKNDWNQLPC